MPLHTSNIRFIPTDTEPAGAHEESGSVYYDTSQSQLKHYDGSDWQKVNTGGNYNRPGDGQYDVDIYTKLLLHCNGDGTDSSGNSHTATANGNATTSTSIKKIGTHSFDCYNADQTGDYWSVGASSDFYFGTDPWTIDLWFYPRNTDGYQIIFLLGTHDAAGEIVFRPTGGGGYNIELNDDANSGTNINATPSGNIAVNAWSHAALVRNGTSLMLFHNGTLVDTADISTRNAGVSNVNIQMGDRGYQSQAFHGLVDEVRVSKGIARWTSNFVVY